ncbi:MAG: hypothetical protein QOI82_419, partial [Actinomycetota bacterium]|nr:hypothetical protein [Actinomycetota bacterium]
MSGAGIFRLGSSRRGVRLVAGAGAAVLTGALIVALGLPAMAVGTTYTVTSFNDDVAACGDPEPTGMTLREAIDCANNNPGRDTVDFSPTIDDVQLVSQVPITDGVDIIGTGESNLVIHGGNDGDGGLDRVFFVHNPAAAIGVSISDLALRDGNTNGHADGRGGAILDVGEDLSLTRVDVENNTSGDDGGGIFLDPEAGATLTLTQTTVEGNTATSSDGGGIAVLPVADTATAAIDLENSRVLLNSAVDGGGLFFQNFLGICLVPGQLPDTCDTNAPAVTVSAESLVDNNTATGRGGGVFTLGPDVTVDTASVEQNSAVGFGGGVFARQATLTLTDAVVDRNRTTSVFNPNIGPGNGGGGGVYADSATLTLTGATVSNNHADSDQGGGILATDECMTATDTTFSGNVAGFDGGGAYLNAPGICALSGLDVTANSAGQDGGGLALFNDGNVSLPLSGSTVSGNDAGRDGGGIYLDSGPNMQLESSTISGNTAVGSGGGIAGSETGPVSNSTISGNTAGFGATGNGEGGGIDSSRSLQVVQSTVSGNQVLSHDSQFQAEGGGIYGDSAPNISLSTIVDNDAVSVGADNTAISGGDGVYSDQGGSVRNSIVANNGGASGEDLSTGVVLVETPLFDVHYSLVEHPNNVLTPGSSNNITGTDPAVGPLADNGGPTLTHLPANDSQAIDAGDPFFEGPQQTDQRGQGFPRVVAIRSATPRIDMGALEVQALAQSPSPSPTQAPPPPPAPASPSPSPSPSPNPQMRYVALTTPTRVLDTRNGTGAPAGTKTGDVTFDLSSVVPAGANGVVLNVTVTGSDHNGHVLGFADGSPYPPTSNLNFVTGQTQANEAIIKVPADRKVVLSIFGAHAHLVADVVGYFVPGDPAGANRVTTRTPSRIFDSRTTTAVRRTGEITLDLSGVVPAGTTSAVLNVTATGASGGGFIVAYPAGTAKPGTSNVNYHLGSTQANEAFVRLGTGADAGKVTLFVDGAAASVIVDLVGTVDPGPGTATELGTPFRSLDTRNGTGGPT